MPGIEPKTSISSLKDSILRWNLKFPVDKWYRERYKIPFGSEQHRKANLLDILIEYEEEMLFRNLEKEARESKEAYADYQETGIFLKKRSKYKEDLTDDEIDAWFNSVDINQLNKNILKKQEEESGEQNRKNNIV